MKPLVFNKIALAIALCAVAIPVFGDDMSTTNPPPATTVITPSDFAWDAALINLSEIRLGQVAQTNSQNAAVQEFGRHMVRDHSRLQERLVKIADEEGLQLPDTNTFNIYVTPPENIKPATELMMGTPQERLLAMQLDVQNLTSLTGPDFDNAYVDAMVKGHEKAVAKFEDASTSLSDEKLQKYAKAALRTVRHHLEMARKLQTDLMQGTNAPASSFAWPSARPSM